MTPNSTEEQTSEKAMQPSPCEHYWASVHEPGHRLYWIRQCMLCHRVDWDELDADIADLAREFPAPEIDRFRSALAEIARKGNVGPQSPSADAGWYNLAIRLSDIAREALGG